MKIDFHQRISLQSFKAGNKEEILQVSRLGGKKKQITVKWSGGRIASDE